MIRRVAVYSVQVCGRFERFSTIGNNLAAADPSPSPLAPSAISKPAVPLSPSAPPKGVQVNTKTSTFSQRINAFLFGAGLGFGVGSYMVFEELSASNKILEDKLASIHDRMEIIDNAK